MTIKIIIDSSSEFSQKEAKELGIYCLPLTIAFGEEIFHDNIDITNEEFYNKLSQCEELPKTSQVTPYQYGEVYREIIAQGDIPFVISLSSKVSGTYNSAVIASKEFDEKIYILDTLSGSIGAKIFIQYALELLKKYDNPEVLYEKLLEKRDKIRIYYLLDTLEYIYKGGRISKFSAIAGALLSVKPIVTLVNGEVELVGKARGFKKASSILTDTITKLKIDKDLPYMLTYSGNDSSVLDDYKEKNPIIFDDINIKQIPVVNMGSTIGTHMGPGTIGISFFVE
ncbi:DegV family protein [Peptostreptococcus canis]|uniref:DegV family protein n=1 Tax=Peptostreptococcus canis TaxID=1159213 RepID=A0ABR6TKG2_9FIRM|nr:DegV family protein [Peptostreptococcus canis]MBC2575723.1 DegV family protein [Peptostreptococcus canis]MBP1998162.1 DegV family protein with EDD domain [Peptostreptococcus canis]